MKFFVDNRMFGASMNGSAVGMARPQAAAPSPAPAPRPVQPPRPAAARKPRFLGQATPSINDIVDRIKTDVGVLGDYYNRNANLPLQFRVPGSIYSNVADYSDAIWKDVVLRHDANPDSQAWTAPAPQSVLSRVALSEQMIADFGNQVSAAEAKYAQSQGNPAAAPTQVATVQPQGQGFQWSLGTAVLGALAIATIAGVLFFTPASPIEGPVSELPRK
jgi:hypothetical protein